MEGGRALLFPYDVLQRSLPIATLYFLLYLNIINKAFLYDTVTFLFCYRIFFYVVAFLPHLFPSSMILVLLFKASLTIFVFRVVISTLLFEKQAFRLA